jgi:hypothetical protein
MPAWKRRGCDSVPDTNLGHGHSPLFRIGRNLESPLKFGTAFGCRHRGNYTSGEKKARREAVWLAKVREEAVAKPYFSHSWWSRTTVII